MYLMPKNKHAVALGKIGGPKGGKSRWAKLSPEEKTALARKMAAASAIVRKKS